MLSVKCDQHSVFQNSCRQCKALYMREYGKRRWRGNRQTRFGERKLHLDVIPNDPQREYKKSERLAWRKFAWAEKARMREGVYDQLGLSIVHHAGKQGPDGMIFVVVEADGFRRRETFCELSQ